MGKIKGFMDHVEYGYIIEFLEPQPTFSHMGEWFRG